MVLLLLGAIVCIFAIRGLNNMTDNVDYIWFVNRSPENFEDPQLIARYQMLEPKPVLYNIATKYYNTLSFGKEIDGTLVQNTPLF